MKATKHTVSITVEVLSLDCVPSLVGEVGEMFVCENVGGSLIKDDGDSVTLSVISKEVKFQ